MGIVIIISSPFVFLIIQYFASLTNEGLEALLFTIPLLNITLLGISLLKSEKKEVSKLEYRKICILISVITIGLILTLVISFFLSDNPHKMNGLNEAYMYIFYVLIVFLISFSYPFSQWRK